MKGSTKLDDKLCWGNIFMGQSLKILFQIQKYVKTTHETVGKTEKYTSAIFITKTFSIEKMQRRK